MEKRRESEGAVQGWRAGVDQFGSFIFEQNLQVDKNLGYGEKHVAAWKILDPLSDRLVQFVSKKTISLSMTLRITYGEAWNFFSATVENRAFPNRRLLKGEP